MLGLLILTCLWTSSQGYSTGAPQQACTTNSPSHGANPQTSSSPYTITVPATSTVASNITVEISGSTFKGFYLYAEDGQGMKYGSFSPNGSDAQAISCTSTDDVITHTSNSIKQSVSVMWTAPAAPLTLNFTAVVVFDKTTFWTGITSMSHSVQAAPATTTSMANQTLASSNATTVPVSLTTAAVNNTIATVSQSNRVICYLTLMAVAAVSSLVL